jgi:hypothetical protein
MPATPHRVVIAASLAQQPHRAGHLFAFVNWMAGLRLLGMEVLLLDRCGDSEIERAGARCVHDFMREFGLDNGYAALEGPSPVAISRTDAVEAVRGSSMLLNFNGFIGDPALIEAARLSVFVDIDPGFWQMWRETGLHDALQGHDAYVSLAERIGAADCEIPTCGINWITTRQPVVLDLWPVCEGGGTSFTSVGAWRGPFAPVECNGKTYGLRAHEFRKFVELPSLTGQDFELALDIHDAEVRDLKLLDSNGWRVVRPDSVAGTPSTYREYIQRSRAEFMVAKGMYVDTRGGWFSDRSACYLASGRPVLAQDTGLRDLYPHGEGLVLFRDLDEAVAGVDSIASDGPRHARAARQIAEDCFDSRLVLSKLLDRLAV